MSINIQLTVNEKDYDIDITNNIVLLGELIVNEIKKQIRSMSLIGSGIGGGSYLQRWSTKLTGDGVVIDSGVEYSAYLEFGTFMFGSMFGTTDFPESAKASKMFKKKDLPKSIREGLPKGMVPMASVRRVIYNDKVMTKLVKQAFA